MRRALPGCLAGAALILLAILLAYGGSLSHAFRSDQLNYLVGTADRETLWGLTAGSASFNREDLGDLVLYRPVLYAWLGLERWLFGVDPRGWRCASLLLHAGVCLTLFSVLRRAGRGSLPWALLGTLWFAVQYSSCELVLWSHISGYLFYSLLFLLTVYLATTLADSRGARKVALFVVALLGAFVYEHGVAWAVLLGLYLLRRTGWSSPSGGKDPRRALGVALLGLGLLYSAASLTDLWVQGKFEKVPESVSDPGTSENHPEGLGDAAETALIGMVTVPAIWWASAMDPYFGDLKEGFRVTVRWPGGPERLGKLARGLALVLVLFLALRWNRRGGAVDGPVEPGVDSGVLRGPLVGATAVYVLLIVLGRGLPRGLGYVLQYNTYYGYFFNLLVLLLIQGFLDPGELFRDRRALRAAGVAGVLLYGSWCSLWRIRDLVVRMDAWGEPRAQLARRVEAVVRGHAHEEGFTFSVREGCGWNEELPRLTVPERFQKYRVGGRPLRVAQAYYPQYYVPSGGKYQVECPGPDRSELSPPPETAMGSAAPPEPARPEAAPPPPRPSPGPG